jgi:hypothetical protein
MPRGKPAGVMCVNLDPASHRCRIWGRDNYPEVCRRFSAEPAACGSSRDEALQLLNLLEIATDVRLRAVNGDGEHR